MLPNILQHILGSNRIQPCNAPRYSSTRRRTPGKPVPGDTLLYRVQDVTGNHLTLSPSAAAHIATVSQSLREGCGASCRLAGRPMQGNPGHSSTINGDQGWVACARGGGGGAGAGGLGD